ncbi:MAG TPA: Ig-like domain-containing protein [Gemmatimonadaceae bacterium]|nr:Ig-like domain-containing protein [Gemmatimonadaceae bacterium]
MASFSQFVQIIVRASGNGDGTYNNYLFYTDGLAGAGHTEVAKNIRGTQITFKSFPVAFATGDVIKISVTGSTITCYKNGVAIGSVVDSDLKTGSPGVGVYGNSVRVDDWEGASLVQAAPAPVAAVAVSPAAATLAVGGTQQLTASTKDSTGAALSGRTVVWSSSNSSAATVDGNGLVSAVAAGSANIVATSEGVSGTATITVAPPAPVATVSVAPANASVVIGGAQQLSAVTKDSAGNTLTGRSVSWASDNSVAAVDTSGRVTGMAAGTATITATSEGKSGSDVVTVTDVPVATVSVSPSSANIPFRGTQQLSAVTKDGSGNVLTGRAVTWASGNTGIASVNASTGLVTAVGSGGPVSITATSEGKTGNASVTVMPPPVATVTVSPASLGLSVGNAQTLTATLRDADNNILTGRAVSWSSDAPSIASVNSAGSVTALSVGNANISATSEGKSASSAVNVSAATGSGGLLHVSARNPRYFENAAGQIVYLTGAHTWSNLQDNGTVDPPPAFNYSAYLDFLVARGHNFFRLWTWEQAKWTAEISSDYWFSGGPYLRTGPGVALDGKPKFDVTQFDQAYFDRLRSRVQDAGARGIYVSIMLFDGWSITGKPGAAFNNPWNGHPFNGGNNINGINGDTNRDSYGLEVETLANSAIVALQDAYVRRVIDAVNDLDNVLYEIDNEGDGTSKLWQYHMIQTIRDYESTKPNRHPIGLTAMWPNGSDADLFASGADWISPTGSIDAPAVATGSKVIIADTDHMCGICGNVSWVWRAFTRGQNPILMDGYDGTAVGVGANGFNAADPKWEAIRKNLGYARSYAVRMNMAAAVPRGDLASSGYCLAVVGSEYLIFLPNASTTINLAGVSGTRTVEWFNPASGQAVAGGTVNGGSTVTIRPPFSGIAVAYIHQ